MGTGVGTKIDMSAEEQAKRPWLKVYEGQMQNALPQLVMGHEGKTPEIQQIVLEQVLKVLLENADQRTPWIAPSRWWSDASFAEIDAEAV